MKNSHFKMIVAFLAGCFVTYVLLRIGAIENFLTALMSMRK